MANRILVVEDERHIMRLIQVNLQRAGYEVAMANNAEQALQAIELAPSDLILIDQTLPDMAGNVLAQTLRQRFHQQSFVLILMFPRDIEDGWTEGWIRSKDCFIVKPFNPMELIAFVKRALGQRPQEGIAHYLDTF